LPGCEARVLYEAGPFGFALARHLEGREKLRCIVVAPSLMPQGSGRRVKTNRRDAKELMIMGWRPGEEVRFARVPTEEEEGERQLLRLREGYVRKRNRVMEQIKSLAYQNYRHDLLGDWGEKHMERLRRAELGY
jgi:transposase